MVNTKGKVPRLSFRACDQLPFNIGDRAVVSNELDKLYGKRGVVEEVAEQHDEVGVRLGPVLLGLRFVGLKKLKPFWPSELKRVSAVDQLSELV